MLKYTQARLDSLVVTHYIKTSDSLSLIGEKTNRFEVHKLKSNTSYSDMTPSFYFDQIVFASSRITDTVGTPELYEWNKQPYLDLFSAYKSKNGELQNIRKLSGQISTELHESSTTFTQDGKTVYFTRNNYQDGNMRKDKQNAVRLKIYKATKIAENSWSVGEELPFNNDAFSMSHPTLNSDESRLYFSSDRPGSFGHSDIWFVERFTDSTYGEPINLGSKINTELRETFPFIDDNNVLYFSTDGRPGIGGLDIFYTQLDAEGMPTEVYRMPEPINSPSDDFSLIKDTATRTGYFASNRENPKESNDDDIYFFKEICEITVNGVVTDEKTNEILPGAQVILLNNGKEVGRMVVGSDASYRFEVSCDTTYKLEVVKEGYNPSDKQFTSPDYSVTVGVPIDLDPIPDPCGDDLGCRLNLKPIYFDLDQHYIRSDAEIELTKIFNALIENPEMKIHIESHTDSRGRDAYNLALSERRAKSTMNWLIDKGISPERLTAKGYGETRLLNECGNGVKCSKEEHQLNRRSVFTIVEE